MAYVVVKGGKQAIDESKARLKLERLKEGISIDSNHIEAGMRLLIDQVMSEGSIYCRSLAALALKQAEGSVEEAVFLLRAYRSTLPRKYYSKVVESSTMQVERRISAAFKDIPGGQVLGTSHDYTHRLINFDLLDETDASVKEFLDNYYEALRQVESKESYSLQFQKVSDFLRAEGLIDCVENSNLDPKDATKDTLTFPTDRSVRLQILTRGMSQAVIALGYASLRGYGTVHPTVGELRVGNLPITINNPLNDDPDDEYTIGEIRVTEVESLIPVNKLLADGTNELHFEIGYGITYGQNETKTIAMSILDQCLESDNTDFATSDHEFVLYHIDSIEATGFISHLKLPHYVTFQAKLNSARKTRNEDNDESTI